MFLNKQVATCFWAKGAHRGFPNVFNYVWRKVENHLLGQVHILYCDLSSRIRTHWESTCFTFWNGFAFKIQLDNLPTLWRKPNAKDVFHREQSDPHIQTVGEAFPEVPLPTRPGRCPCTAEGTWRPVRTIRTMTSPSVWEIWKLIGSSWSFECNYVLQSKT